MDTNKININQSQKFPTQIEQLNSIFMKNENINYVTKPVLSALFTLNHNHDQLQALIGILDHLKEKYILFTMTPKLQLYLNPH